MVKVKKIREAKSDRIFSYFNTGFLIIAALVVLYPLIYIISSSFSSGSAIISGKVWLLPVEPSIEGYVKVFEYGPVWQGYANTIIYTLFGTTLSVILTIMAAYPLSRNDFHGKNFYMFLVVFTMFFNGGLIPTYILINKLGLIDTRWAMILPNALAAWNIIITRTFYKSTLSPELLEAAKMEGCSDIRYLIKVVVPLSGAIVAVNVLYYAVGIWNQFFWAFILLNDPKLFPLQVILRKILILNQTENSFTVNVKAEAARQYLKELIKYSLIIIASAPVLILYPFVQKYFVKGVMIGSVKG